MKRLYFGNLDEVKRLFALWPDLVSLEGEDALHWLSAGVMNENYATADAVRQMILLLKSQCKNISCTRFLQFALDLDLSAIPNITLEQIRKGTLDIVNDALDCPDVDVNRLIDWVVDVKGVTSQQWRKTP